MKLFAFQPEGHGPCSYFVMAESEKAARAAVRQSIVRRLNASRGDLTHWDSGRHGCAALDPGEVITNDND